MQAFWLLALVVFMGIALLSLRAGLIVYLVGALIFPSLWFGEEVALRMELVYCLWLLFIFSIRKASSGFTFRWHSVLSKYGLFLVTIIFSTMLSLVSIESESSFIQFLIKFYGFLRPLLVMLLFLNVPADEKFVHRILWVFVGLSIPIALLCLGQTFGLGVAQEITLGGYTSPSRTPVFKLLEEQGVILRATGVFESPVYNAVYLPIVAITSIYLLIKQKYPVKNHLLLYFVLGLSAIAGIATLSASFLVGVPIVILLSLVFLWHKYLRRFHRFAISASFVIGVLLLISLPKLLENPTIAGSLHYQMERVLEGKALQTRYNLEAGILAPAYEAIIKRPIFGWGLIQREDVFVGDSAYVSALYLGGVIGLALLFLALWSILRHSRRFREADGPLGDVNWLVFLYTLLLIPLSMGSPSFWLLRFQEWYWALVGMSLNPSLRGKPTLKAGA